MSTYGSQNLIIKTGRPFTQVQPDFAEFFRLYLDLHGPLSLNSILISTFPLSICRRFRQTFKTTSRIQRSLLSTNRSSFTTQEYIKLCFIHLIAASARSCCAKTSKRMYRLSQYFTAFSTSPNRRSRNIVHLRKRQQTVSYPSHGKPTHRPVRYLRRVHINIDLRHCA